MQPVIVYNSYDVLQCIVFDVDGGVGRHCYRKLFAKRSSLSYIVLFTVAVPLKFYGVFENAHKKNTQMNEQIQLINNRARDLRCDA